MFYWLRSFSFVPVLSEFPGRLVRSCMWDWCGAEWCRKQKNSWAEDRGWKAGETLPFLRRRICVGQGKLEFAFFTKQGAGLHKKFTVVLQLALHRAGQISLLYSSLFNIPYLFIYLFIYWLLWENKIYLKNLRDLFRVKASGETETLCLLKPENVIQYTVVIVSLWFTFAYFMKEK